MQPGELAELVAQALDFLVGEFSPLRAEKLPGPLERDRHQCPSPFPFTPQRVQRDDRRSGAPFVDRCTDSPRRCQRPQPQRKIQRKRENGFMLGGPAARRRSKSQVECGSR